MYLFQNFEILSINILTEMFLNKLFCYKSYFCMQKTYYFTNIHKCLLLFMTLSNINNTLKNIQLFHTVKIFFL